MKQLIVEAIPPTSFYGQADEFYAEQKRRDKEMGDKIVLFLNSSEHGMTWWRAYVEVRTMFDALAPNTQLRFEMSASLRQFIDPVADVTQFERGLSYAYHFVESEE